MSLSVLQIGHSGPYILYDSKQKCAILEGTQDECFDFKHTMELCQQNVANRQYFEEVKKERLEILISAGHSQQTAEDFLKKHMAYLYEKV